VSENDGVENRQTPDDKHAQYKALYHWVYVAGFCALTAVVDFAFLWPESHLGAFLVLATAFGLIAIFEMTVIGFPSRWVIAAVIALYVAALIASWIAGPVPPSLIEKTVKGLQSQNVPRRVSAEQRAIIIAAPAPFAGQKVTIICTNTSWDCTNFAGDFQSAFRAAKWDVPDTIAIGIPMGLDPVGVEFGVNPGWAPDTPPAVLNTLGITMIRLGFARPPVNVARVTTIPFGTIEFRIGRIIPPE